MNELEKAIEDCEQAFKGLTPLNAAAYMLGRIKSLRFPSLSEKSIQTSDSTLTGTATPKPEVEK